MPPAAPAERVAIAERMREQAGWCSRLGSPLYAHLLDRIADDVTAGGPAADVLAGHDGDPRGSALALRLMGAGHRLVLEGRAPALAAHYPSAGGDATSGDAWPAFRAVLTTEAAAVRALLDRPVQTNEVGRCAALLGGFLAVARETSLPLAVLELGASAGLNLRWDLYRYVAGERVWGDPGSTVEITCEFEGAPPPRAGSVEVVLRAGCDRHPVDPTTADGALTLQSYVWPDQLDRLALLRAALAVARRVPVRLDTADAARWVEARLAERSPAAATVVYHSIVWQYLDRAARDGVRHAIASAGAASDVPLAWLRLEPVGPEGPYEVRLTTWPGARERRLAEASPHGRRVRWLESGFRQSM